MLDYGAKGLTQKSRSSQSRGTVVKLDTRPRMVLAEFDADKKAGSYAWCYHGVDFKISMHPGHQVRYLWKAPIN